MIIEKGQYFIFEAMLIIFCKLSIVPVTNVIQKLYGRISNWKFKLAHYSDCTQVYTVHIECT